MSTVGKIYTPQLRCDAAGRYDKRGLRVSVSLRRAAHAAAPAIEQALAAYLFETTVSVT